MAPHANSKSLSATALSSLLERRAAAANAVPSKLARRRDRNLRRRAKGAGKDKDKEEHHEDHVEGDHAGEKEHSKRASAVVLHGTLDQKREKIEERVMMLKRQRRISKEEREVRRRIMDLRSGRTRHVPEKKQENFDDSDEDF